MALLKYLLTYAIAAVALMYFQSSGAFAAKTCIFCSNAKPDNLTTNSTYCDANPFTEGKNTHFYCKNDDEKGQCIGYSFNLNNKTTVIRGCGDIDCAKINKTANALNIVCKSCSEDKCNNFNLTSDEDQSSSTQIGYSIVPLVFSIVLAMYPN